MKAELMNSEGSDIACECRNVDLNENSELSAIACEYTNEG